MSDIFISYTKADESWAVWVAWQLEALGYSTLMQAWDFVAGSNAMFEMQRGATEALRTVAILSPDYLTREYPTSEWMTAVFSDPIGSARRFVPVRVRACRPTGHLAPIVYVDLVGRNEDNARSELAAAFKALTTSTRRKPERSPPFPGNQVPTFPGSRDSGQLDAPAARAENSANSRIRLVHTAITKGTCLDLTSVNLPYLSVDATSPVSHINTVHVFLWVPPADYFRQPRLEPLTPCAAIVTPDMIHLAESFRDHLGSHEDSVLRLPPAKLRPLEKEAAFESIRRALDNSLVACVVVPEAMLSPSRSRPSLAAQTMCDQLLLPIAKAHQNCGLQHFAVRIVATDEGTGNVLKQAKKIATVAFPRRNCRSVEVVADDRLGKAVGSATRLLAWAVGAYYNERCLKWLQALESAETNNAYPPRMEEYASQ